MDIPNEAYPLTWPANWPRHKGTRERAQFSRRVAQPGKSWTRRDVLTLAQAITRLQIEIRSFTRPGKPWRIDPDRVVISSNMLVRKDGIPMSGRSDPDDVGVAVYFTFDGKPCVLACDKWDRLADNVAAVAAHLGAMRGMDRWGVGRLEQVFTGYTALPAPGESMLRDWWDVLKCSADAPFDKVQSAYREAIRRAHPDTGGDTNDAARVNVAWAAAKAHFGVR